LFIKEIAAVSECTGVCFSCQVSWKDCSRKGVGSS